MAAVPPIGFAMALAMNAIAKRKKQLDKTAAMIL